MKSVPTTVALSVELSDKIYRCLQDFLAAHPDWNQQRVMDASLSLFFLQNHSHLKPEDYQACSQQYLHSVCGVAPAHSSPTRNLL